MNSYENMLGRLKEQTEAQIDFVNNASHELKTPIFIIDGYINLIKRWGINDEKISREAIDSISEETKNMDSLVKKLLFLAKDNKSTLEITDFSLDKVISDIVNDLKIVYPKQTMSFNAKNHIIKSDYYLIKQLFFNLIENSIKYGKENPIEIDITSNKNIIVAIKDGGEGISEENLKHIYDKFFRVDKARSRNIGSHGLGLSIVNKIANILNIDIEIKSPIEIDITSNKNIIVAIKDEGEGISEENLKHIYDKFFRVDKARSRNIGSHGLGLSIVNKIANILNIDIEIKSKVGVGSTFIVTLPTLNK